MFGGPVTSGLTFTKVLGGISKTLGVANQIIPLYREAKPMINNARTILSVLKDVNKGSKTSSNNKKTTNDSSSTNTNNTSSKVIRNNNNPVFFL